MPLYSTFLVKLQKFCATFRECHVALGYSLRQTMIFALQRIYRFISRTWVCFNYGISRRQQRRLIGLGLLSVVVILSISLLINTRKLPSSASAPVDVFFVLGGSIRRELYVAQLDKQHPETRILISQGSKDPCILIIFQKYEAPIRQVWLEKCADSTFGNFFFNIPIFKQWGVRKVKLITSPTHLPRAKWMAQILLGAHGIWVEVDAVKERGVPGNQESWVKTGLDLTRSLIWAFLSQAIQPPCSHVTALTDVDLVAWNKSGFECEKQGRFKRK